MNDLRIVHGSVKMIHCRICESTIPIFVFEGEADVDTMGLCSAGSCERFDVAVLEAEPDEWNDLASGRPEVLQSRIANELGRSDLRILKVLKMEEAGEVPAGTSFAEFRKLYRPPIVVYECPCCSVGEAREHSELTISSFNEIGGRIFTVGRLAIEGAEG